MFVTSRLGIPIYIVCDYVIVALGVDSFLSGDDFALDDHYDSLNYDFNFKL